MQTGQAIAARRSIRRFSAQPVEKSTIEAILEAGILAPSAKNRQPWKFYVVESAAAKAQMLDAIRAGIEREQGPDSLLPGRKNELSIARATLRAVEQAPLTILVFNRDENYLFQTATAEQQLYDVANLQSIGAAIQNMLLTATDLGLGSLWNCNIFFSYAEICSWLGESGQLIAALSFGYAEEAPAARPRKTAAELVVWK